eukprot:353447-Chlamydomonas_euryale.AAC.6
MPLGVARAAAAPDGTVHMAADLSPVEAGTHTVEDALHIAGDIADRRTLMPLGVARAAATPHGTVHMAADLCPVEAGTDV